MGFFCVFGFLLVTLGFVLFDKVGFALLKFVDWNGLLGFPFLLLNLFLFVQGASIFSKPKASQKLPISCLDCALSTPYLACNLSSLPNVNPSDLIMPNNCPNVSKLKGISFVAKFCLSQFRIRSPNNPGSPTISVLSKIIDVHLLFGERLLGKRLCTIYNLRALGIADW